MTLGVNGGGDSLKQLRESVRRTPGDAAAWFALGSAAIAAGETGEARFAFTQSVYLAPEDVQQAIDAASLLAAAASPAEGEHILRRALDRVPGHNGALARLAQLLLDTGREDDVLAELAGALQGGAASVELRLLAAIACERRGNLDEAAEHLAAAIAAEPDHLEASRRLGAVLSQLGDTEGAVRCWRRIVAHSGGQDPEALTGLGISLSSDGKHDEAVKILDEVARRRGSAASLADLGMALNAAGRVDEAAAAFGRALQLEPRSAQAYCGLGIAYQRQARWHEAAQAFRATEQLAPESAVGPLNLGLALKELGDSDGARRALLRAAAREPDDPEIHAALEATLGADDPGRTPVPTPARGFEASITGDLKSFQLFDVLEFLRLQKKTGALVVSSRNGAGIIRLAAGALTSASAPGVRRLGETLVASRLITPHQLDLALAHQRGEPGENVEHLGAVLLREGLITREWLTTAIGRQVMAALDQMLTWPEGAFSFHPAEVSDTHPAMVSFDLQDVMLRLMRRKDEHSAGRPHRPD